MRPNFWLYRINGEQDEIAGTLITFGAEVAVKANILQGLDILQECNKALQANQQYDNVAIGRHFGLDYLRDSIIIFIFFDDYMKSESIVRNFCVHNIDKLNSNRFDLIALVKQQDKRPITLSKIREVEEFVVNDEKKPSIMLD